jgi:hypothetical protein
VAVHSYRRNKIAGAAKIFQRHVTFGEKPALSLARFIFGQHDRQRSIGSKNNKR